MPHHDQQGGYAPLEAKLGHRFVDHALLENALCHRSYLNENPGEDRGDNERLEFLGDAVLGMVVGHILFQHFPDAREGDLSMIRAQVVNEHALTEVAQEIGLGQWLFLGKGEERSGGRGKPSIVSDAFEAVLAAVYLDGGFVAVERVIRRLFEARCEKVTRPGAGDFKTRLQEVAQARLHETPRYQLIGETGPDHKKSFEVAVLIGTREYARAHGSSKKEAEQHAAQAALEALGPPP